MKLVTIQDVCKVVQDYIEDKWLENRLSIIVEEDGVEDISGIKVNNIVYGKDSRTNFQSQIYNSYDAFRFEFELNSIIYNMDYIVSWEEVKHHKFVPHKQYSIEFHDNFTEVKLIKIETNEKTNEKDKLLSIWHSLVTPKISTDIFIKSHIRSLYEIVLEDKENKQAINK